MSSSSGAGGERSASRRRRRSSTDRRVGVLVVDDSALMRRLITDIISETEEFRVVGVAHDGREALEKVHRLDPDVVTMDVEMPELDGLQALGYIMSETPRPVVMLSAYTVAGGEMTLRALDFGAVDFVAKPTGDDADSIETVRDRLIDALRAAAVANLSNVTVRMPRRDTRSTVEGFRSEAAPANLGPRGTSREISRSDGNEPVDGVVPVVIAIAASTGGPRALLEVISSLPRGLRAAILVVQHMPAAFIGSFGDRLDRAAALPVRVARDSERVRSGRVYLAPGGYHMRVRGTRDEARIALSREPAIWGVRPAADPLFESLAEVFGESTIGVVLTGMGRDGANGLKAIQGARGGAFAQDRQSSVVFGMPQAALAVGAEPVSLHQMAGRIVQDASARTGMTEIQRRP